MRVRGTKHKQAGICHVEEGFGDGLLELGAQHAIQMLFLVRVLLDDASEHIKCVRLILVPNIASCGQQSLDIGNLNQFWE